MTPEGKREVVGPEVLAAMQGHKSDEGLSCRECGCRDFRVIETRQENGYIRRRRECRHCAARATTREEIVGGHRP